MFRSSFKNSGIKLDEKEIPEIPWSWLWEAEWAVLEEEDIKAASEEEVVEAMIEDAIKGLRAFQLWYQVKNFGWWKSKRNREEEN